MTDVWYGVAVGDRIEFPRYSFISVYPAHLNGGGANWRAIWKYRFFRVCFDRRAWRKDDGPVEWRSMMEFGFGW